MIGVAIPGCGGRTPGRSIVTAIPSISRNSVYPTTSCRSSTGWRGGMTRRCVGMTRRLQGPGGRRSATGLTLRPVRRSSGCARRSEMTGTSSTTGDRRPRTPSSTAISPIPRGGDAADGGRGGCAPADSRLGRHTIAPCPRRQAVPQPRRSRWVPPAVTRSWRRSQTSATGSSTGTGGGRQRTYWS